MNVNFPVDSTEYTDTGEGGLVVELAVMPSDEDGDRVGWAPMPAECFVGDDVCPFPGLPQQAKGSFPSFDSVTEYYNRLNAWTKRHFPFVDDETKTLQERNGYRRCLERVEIGATKWSGYSDEEGRYWHCTYDDLTDEGKKLYNELKQKYPGRQVHIMTFLET
jgi:hypothetical protein